MISVFFPFFQNVHQGNPTETLVRFLKARDWHVIKAQKMVISSAAIFLFNLHVDESQSKCFLTQGNFILLACRFFELEDTK